MSQIYRAKDYARLRARLSIDRNALDDELVEMPGLLVETCDYAEESSVALARAVFDHKTAVAVASAILRGELIHGKARSETAITSEAQVDDNVIAAMEAVEEAKANAAYWNVLVEGMRSKQSSIKRLVELAVAGWMTTGAYSKEAADPRAALTTERRRRAVLREGE